jgi:ribosomal protein S18 acetylase RimI-like enzyme
LAFIVQEHQQGDGQSMSVSIEGPYFKKAIVCTPILRSLPAWFGIEEAIVHYSTEIDNLPTLLACEAERVIGFVSLKQHTRYSAEIYVMGIQSEAHRKGIGRALINQAEEWLMSREIEYLQVKTLGPSHNDESYARTRAFYAAMGFRPLEEFKQIWDEHNPCLVMIKKL